MIRRNDGDLPAPFEPGEGLAEGPITRSRAIELLGVTIAGGALVVILPAEADACKRRRRRRRRRRARVNQPTPVMWVPGNNVISITNPSPPTTSDDLRGKGDRQRRLGRLHPALIGGPVTLRPDQTIPVTVNLDAADLVNANGLRLIDGRGIRITVVDENGVVVGDIDVA